MGYSFPCYYKLKYYNLKLQTCRAIMVAPKLDRMPIQSPSWTEFLYCPVCTHEFATNIRAPITLGCGHSICKNCLTTLHRKQCPYDQTEISKNFENFPINYALLQLTTSTNNAPLEREISPYIVQSLTSEELKFYKTALKCIEELALLLKPSGSMSGLLSRPMQRKLVTLINCQLIESEGRTRSLRSVRSLGERTVTELILQHQNPHQLSTNLWAAVRGRGCQFLGPAMQEEVLKLVLLALEDGSALSRKTLVMYVVQQLEPTFPQASKTSIGHVVQLLYRASCFKVSKRDGDSSLMTLKEEFRTYDALRREHDTQIVQIATEAGLRIAPDQWSALLYGDSNHKSHMQSIIDKQQSPSSFAQSVDELMLALQRTGDPANLAKLRVHLENLSNIDSSMDFNVVTTWKECMESLASVRDVVFGLIDFIQHHGKNKVQESYNQHTSRFKVSFCRELQTRGICGRGNNCNFAHSDDELEHYRAKYKKNALKNIIPINQQHKESSSANNAVVSNGPNQKVNMNHPNFAKCPNDTNSTNTSRMISSKSIPYRSENSLHHSPLTQNRHHQQQPQQINHLRPSNTIYNLSGSNVAASSSSSTPNLSQLQLSPNQIVTKPSQQQQANSRFSFNGANRIDSLSQASGGQFINSNFNQRPPPMSAVGNNNNNYKKQMSPYHSSMPPHIQQQQQQQGPSRMHPMNNGNGNAYYGQNQNSSSPIYRNGSENNGKYMQWQQPQQQRSVTNNLYTPNKASKSAVVNGNSATRQMQFHCEMDEVDGPVGNNIWHPPPHMKAAATQPSYLFSSPKDKFVRSDSILATNHTDENYENFTSNGKYGAIGIKSTESLQSQRPQSQWSGLQDSFSNLNISNESFDIAGSSGNNNMSSNSGNALKIIDSLNKNDDSTHHHYGINGNFLNIQTSNTSTKPTTTTNDYWNIKESSSKGLDINALENGMSVLNLLDLINE